MRAAARIQILFVLRSWRPRPVLMELLHICAKIAAIFAMMTCAA